MFSRIFLVKMAKHLSNRISKEESLHSALIYAVLLEGFDPHVRKSPFLYNAPLNISVQFLRIVSNTQ